MPHHFCEGSASLPRPASGQGNQRSQHSCLEEVVLLSLSLSAYEGTPIVESPTLL